MNVKTTFLNGYLYEKVYMQQHKGFIVKRKENMVCKLKKYIHIHTHTYIYTYVCVCVCMCVCVSLI